VKGEPTGKENRKRVLFLGLNYTPEAIGVAVYSTGLCEAIAAAGHAVEVVAAKPYYPMWRVFQAFRGWGYRRSQENGVRITRCPIYVPANPTGVRRLLHHLSFAIAAFLPMLFAIARRRPDIVVTVAPSLIAAPVAWIAARVSGAASWLHIQDFEMEAAFATGLLDAQGRGARAARAFEHAIITRFNRVSSISPEMCAKAVAMGVPAARVRELRNWAELDTVQPMASAASPFRAKWGITAAHVALYSGNIANKQGIEIVVDAARLLVHRADVCFIVCGEGANRERLEQRAAGLTNIRFHDLQPFDALGDLLGLATIHLLPQKASAADLVLPSKLTNMLASGKPVVTTAALGSGLAREVEGCGLTVEPENSAAFAAAIQQLIADSALYAFSSASARPRAFERWSKSRITSEFVKEIGLAAERGS